MAKHLARIHGTEEDKVNCPFYFKIGACRHEDRCSRVHLKPAFSQTVLFKHIYRNPAANLGGLPSNVTPEQAYDHFLDFFEDMHMELSKFGRIEGLHVVDNVGDHLIGHVYVKFSDEEEAADAMEKMKSRYYDGTLLQCEFSPVTDFREARCRDFDEDTCSRAGFCNFLHVKPVPSCLVRSLEEDAIERKEEERRAKREERKKRKHDRKESKRSKRSRRSHSASSSDRSDQGGTRN